MSNKNEQITNPLTALIQTEWTAHQGWAPSPFDMAVELDADKYPFWCEVVSQSDAEGNQVVINGHFGIEIARIIAAAPDLLKLARRVANLNPKAGEIGPGMLASLVEEAQAAVKKAEPQA